MTQGCHTSPVWCGSQGRLSPGLVGTRQVSLFATPFLSLFTASGSESVVFTPVRSHTFSCWVPLRQRPALQKHAPGIRAHAQAGPRIWETLSQLPACWTPPPRAPPAHPAGSQPQDQLLSKPSLAAPLSFLRHSSFQGMIRFSLESDRQF